jgi:hypothetical protein
MVKACKTNRSLKAEKGSGLEKEFSERADHHYQRVLSKSERKRI